MSHLSAHRTILLAAIAALAACGDGSDPGFVAYPPPGFVPTAAALGDFSFESQQFAPTQESRVLVAIGDGEPVVVEHRFLQGNYGHYGTAIAFAPPGGVNAAWSGDTRVRVRITATRGGDVDYTVAFTSCP